MLAWQVILHLNFTMKSVSLMKLIIEREATFENNSDMDNWSGLPQERFTAHWWMTLRWQWLMLSYTLWVLTSTKTIWSMCSTNPYRTNLLCRVCLSAARSQWAGGANPVSDSLMPVSSFTRFIMLCMSSSVFLMVTWYIPAPCYKVSKHSSSLVPFHNVYFIQAYANCTHPY